MFQRAIRGANNFFGAPMCLISHNYILATVKDELGIMRFDSVTKEMYLESYHPGVTLKMIQDNTGWDLKIADDVTETVSPSNEEIMILRNELDPGGPFLKKK